MTKTGHWNEGNKKSCSKFKKISNRIKERTEGTVKALLHASRDSLRNNGVDTSCIRFDCREGFVGEAFGIMRALEMMGYGVFASDNLDGLNDSSTKYRASQPEQNLKWWFRQLEEEVLVEENCYGDGHCDYCISRYHSDTKTAKEAGRLNREGKIADHRYYMRELRDFASKNSLGLEVAAKLSGLLDSLENARIR